MKKNLKSISLYFKRIYYSFLGLDLKIKLSKTELIDRFGGDKLNLNRSKKLIDDLEKEGKKDLEEEKVIKQFIANRKKYNEYRLWHSKLVGTKKPFGELKRMVSSETLYDKLKLQGVERKLNLAKIKKRDVVKPKTNIEPKTDVKFESRLREQMELATKTIYNKNKENK